MVNQSGSVMALPNLPPADAGQLERFFRRAVWRIRLERLRATLGVMVWALLSGATIWTAALLWRPEWALGAPFGIGLAAALLLLAADAALFWQVDRRRVVHRLDRQLGLADAAVSADELAGGPRDEWRRQQLAHTIHDLADRSWDERWPRRWPRFTGLAAATLALLCALLIGAYFVEKAGAQSLLTPFQQAQFQALEEVFKDWEEAEKKFDDPELRERLAELKPLREQILAGKLTEKEALVALSRIEDKLAAARKSLEAQSLEPSAAELASAFEPIEGMSAMAAALRRKDFAQAEKLAAELADKLAQPEAKLPEGAQKPENQQRLANAAATLQQRQQEAASQAMRKMEQGMKNSDAQQTGEGMQGMKKSFGGQAKRDTEKQRLALQLAQMGQCKECLGTGQRLARGMSLVPRLATSKDHGNGAGSEIDPNRFGTETKLASSRTEEKVTGALDTGDSEITTEKTGERTRESASAARSAGFREYEKLSREAIEDESIPLAHRQAIRKYFEMIRPAEK
jgi:hypothetical protein